MNGIGHNSNEGFSVIEEEILELIKEYGTEDSFYLPAKAEEVILNYLYDLERKHPTFQYNYMTSPWPDMNGASAYLAWIENGTLYTMGLEYEYEYDF